MADMMTFPDTWEEYEKIYGFNDVDQVYTNGSRLIPSFRVKQWLDHIKGNEVSSKIEDDRYWLSLIQNVVDGKMSDAEANQAWLEYINHKYDLKTER